jgi:NAD(P)-dependent dehydrogenase (short-subunit alcohol dehydrogenase family)
MRSALITGGTGGLGSAVTETFLAAGWRCVVPWNAAREVDRLRERPAIRDAGEQLELVEADLFDVAAAGDMVAMAESAAAPLAAVVNLVGGFAAGGRVHETPVEDFEEQFRLNLRPTYLVCGAAIPVLLDHGQGAIVCVSSRAALRPFAGAAGYVASKAAVLAFVDALAAEYTGDGVRVNAVLPSVIDTPGNRAAQPDADHERWVAPEQIGRVIEFLCSDGAEPISGAHVPVYGRA